MPQIIPSYRLHKPSGRAVVTLSGRDHYLGAHGSPESRREYDRLVAGWLAARGAPAPGSTIFSSNKSAVTRALSQEIPQGL
jgi:hypothetical protein